MSKIWTDHHRDWFLEIDHSLYSEGQLEEMILSYLTMHLNGYYIVKCKMDCLNTKTNEINRPDIAIVKKDFTEWYVVEVELSSHRFKHIEEQVDTFLNCNYGASHATNIADNLLPITKIDYSEELTTMINTHVPKVLVLINSMRNTWFDTLNKMNCETGVFQIYRNKATHLALRFKGHFPLMNQDFGTCRFTTAPFLIEIIEKDFLDSVQVSEHEIIEATYEGRISQWKRVNSRNKIYLECMGNDVPLNPMTPRYLLVCNKAEREFQFVIA
jgi:hypothetical protein